MTLNPYAQRKTLRTLEKLWVRTEGLINRFTKSDFNPFYHLGTLTIFMLVVLILSHRRLPARPRRCLSNR
jgi:hypothetical protein